MADNFIAQSYKSFSVRPASKQADLSSFVLEGQKQRNQIAETLTGQQYGETPAVKYLVEQENPYRKLSSHGEQFSTHEFELRHSESGQTGEAGQLAGGEQLISVIDQ